MNAGLLAGIINGFCYVGSAVSTYGLGKISVDFGWNMVFYILLALCSLMAVICIVYIVLQKVKNKKNA
jgi:sugar phosphate permease